MRHYAVKGPFNSRKDEIKLMEIILLFVVGFIVLIIAIFSVVKMTANRVTASTNDLKEEVTHLRKRIDELENEK